MSKEIMQTIGIVFVCLASLVCLINIATNVSFMFRKRKDPAAFKRSHIHVLSIVFSIMAYAFAKDALGAWVFIPAIADPATIFIFMAPVLLFHRIKKNGARPNDP